MLFKQSEFYSPEIILSQMSVSKEVLYNKFIEVEKSPEQTN